MLFLQPSNLLNRLKTFRYKSPYPLPTVYPSGRRSVVLILLFIGRQGDLRVLLTKRSRGLKSYSGHVSLPGGKADSDSETVEQIARREAEEEIGLPRDPIVLRDKYGMGIENVLVDMPCYMSTSFLSVKPLVCFLFNDSNKDSRYTEPLNVNDFFGRLNPGETSSIFSVPLSDLSCHLFPKNIDYTPEYVNRRRDIENWGGLDLKVYHYNFPTVNPNDENWLNDVIDTSSGDELEDGLKCRDCWGLTANIIYDVSKIAHGIIDSSPDNAPQIGSEPLLYGLYELGGQLRPGKRSDWESGMITFRRKFKYSDVLPAFYLDKLELRYDSEPEDEE
ncbi:hypothetical protein Kpol_1036p96 [Vanderwaltozyma polyspora DSM 70294]|uniref:Nudix hydrolase domain-containing protein n=1 Tax=Vanderwaltozyma polyspora (strain ATCC 22028 / DSM 70294 / BCRC 21397 / CBS 2163 / NBRC 10782 / NRRL Y-8283 / UCD 57-17) TaxID=436907 RepID=A7TEP2_VANPO|nr:uncharacterized protein Kpol_1036p96 [Vanderwaltozyma polyspora DSM 70294]EDO19349.1 hypothetical protein Kpol_1036p96 [Vanderwaltozyma polyspora DSM 70294]